MNGFRRVPVGLGMASRQDWVRLKTNFDFNGVSGGYFEAMGANWGHLETRARH